MHCTQPEPRGLLQSGSENTQKNNPLIPGNTGGGDLTIQPLGADDLFLTALSTGKQAKRAFTPCLHTTLGVAPDPKVLKDLGLGPTAVGLLEFGLGTGFDELFEGCVGVGFGHGFFDSLGSAVDHVFGFFQA